MSRIWGSDAMISRPRAALPGANPTSAIEPQALRPTARKGRFIAIRKPLVARFGADWTGGAPLERYADKPGGPAHGLDQPASDMRVRRDRAGSVRREPLWLFAIPRYGYRQAPRVRIALLLGPSRETGGETAIP